MCVHGVVCVCMVLCVCAWCCVCVVCVCVCVCVCEGGGGGGGGGGGIWQAVSSTCMFVVVCYTYILLYPTFPFIPAVDPPGVWLYYSAAVFSGLVNSAFLTAFV